MPCIGIGSRKFADTDLRFRFAENIQIIIWANRNSPDPIAQTTLVQ